ncbi:GH36-type glycosyl hydrolase domain-containing protein [Anaerotaenia torta]|uniref:GH36-type glycosyl hydrolase domain-containing protein n=1 Tax=Anaerotaenia torta TaxID=433293 RepID=UPI003D1BB34E
MKGYEFLDEKGRFRLENPESTSYLYFPIANECGVMSCVTPTLGGDSKMGQNTFLLAPVSSEDLHNNKSSRNFWCRINDKEIWSAVGKSASQEAKSFLGEKEETVLEAGVMWHKLSRTSKELGLQSEVLSFVPHTPDQAELMMVTLTNCGEKPCRVLPTAAIPLYGRSADNIRDHRNVTSMLHRVETSDFGVLLNPTLTFDERGHQKNTVVYGAFGSTGEGEAPDGFYPVVEDFIGEGGSLEAPRSIIQKKEPVKAGYRRNGYEAMGGICFPEVLLEPGAAKTYIIVLEYGDSPEELERTAGKFRTRKACLKAWEAARSYWEEKINVAYHTGSRDFDAWMHWVNFQPMLRRIYGCSFLPHHDYGRGGRGWRDLWQDCLALLIMNPSGVREMLVSNFGGVRTDGTNATIIGTKQGEFIADRNNITRVWMDHGVWPFLTTRLYIMQSGDVNILLEENYYFKDPQAVRGEEKDPLWKPEDGNRARLRNGQEYRGSILEHMLIEHLAAFYDVGEHNHIRLRGADWNDALDMAKERGESVAFTSIYGSNLEQMAELILELKKAGIPRLSFFEELKTLLEEDSSLYEDVEGKQALLRSYCDSCRSTLSGGRFEIDCEELAANLKRKAAWIRSHIRATEWITSENGYSWYNGYYDDHGRRVEGDHPLGVRMMLTGQVFAIMSNTADEEQVRAITAAADAYLYQEEIGGYKLNTDFKEVKDDLGRMFGFAYGHKENGAVFSHMAVMYANALYQRGFVPEGYKVIRSLYRHCIDFEKIRIYPGIPEYIGDNGRGLYHYLTGSASWLLLTVLTEMFGIKGEMGNLLLEPKLVPEQFDASCRAEAALTFAGRRLRICYENSAGKEYGAYRIGRLLIDGEEYGAEEKCSAGEGRKLIARTRLEALAEDREHLIMVELI